jgi:hypothetical protein
LFEKAGSQSAFIYTRCFYKKKPQRVQERAEILRNLTPPPLELLSIQNKSLRMSSAMQMDAQHSAAAVGLNTVQTLKNESKMLRRGNKESSC